MEDIRTLLESRRTARKPFRQLENLRHLGFCAFDFFSQCAVKLISKLGWQSVNRIVPDLGMLRGACLESKQVSIQEASSLMCGCGFIHAIWVAEATTPPEVWLGRSCCFGNGEDTGYMLAISVFSIASTWLLRSVNDLGPLWYW